MFDRKQAIMVAGSVLVASVGAMALIAGAAFVGLKGDALTAMSTVISTALAAVAIVASLGVAELSHETSPDSADRGGSLDFEIENYAAAKIRRSLNVDLERGQVCLVLGGTRIALMLAPEEIVIRPRARAGSPNGE